MIRTRRMLARRRLVRLPAIVLISTLLAACVGAPDDVAPLSADHPLVQRSERGLVEATVALDGSKIIRGGNDFSVVLRAEQAAALPALSSVEASMAAHGHHASAASIVRDGETFRVVDLDLFMSGRWQIALGVELDSESDLVEFALDVP